MRWITQKLDHDAAGFTGKHSLPVAPKTQMGAYAGLTRSQCSGTANWWTFIVLVVIGFCIWLVSERVGRNDMLLHEAKLLKQTRNYWDDHGRTNQLPGFSVYGRFGNIEIITNRLDVDGQTVLGEIGRTNSCLGSGTVIITSSNTYVLQTRDGKRRFLNIPAFRQIPTWWYLENP